MHTEHPLMSPTPQQAPQQYLQQPPLAVLQNPIPNQGVMNTQQEVNPAPPQMMHYRNPSSNQHGNSTDHNTLLIIEEEILLQTHGHRYGVPLEYTPTTLEVAPTIVGQPLMIPCPNNEPHPRIPPMPLRQNVHNPHSRETHNYSLVDELT
jgi:hypothetical protein